MSNFRVVSTTFEYRDDDPDVFSRNVEVGDVPVRWGLGGEGSRMLWLMLMG
jgi:hypothetical protein